MLRSGTDCRRNLFIDRTFITRYIFLHRCINIHLVPRLASRWYGRNLREKVVYRKGGKESTEVVDVVEINGANRYVPTDSANKPHDVDEDACNVGGVRMPGETEGEVVRTVFAGGIEMFGLDITLADDVVIADHDTGDRREEHGICRKISGKVIRA